MTLIEQIKADREAGTAGPWVSNYELYDNGWTLDTEGDNTVTGIGPKCEHDQYTPIAAVAVEAAFGLDDVLDANARRIARVPEMEEALLSAEELANAIKAVIDLEENTSPFGGEMQADRIERTQNRCIDALTAYRKATGTE